MANSTRVLVKQTLDRCNGNGKPRKAIAAEMAVKLGLAPKTVLSALNEFTSEWDKPQPAHARAHAKRRFPAEWLPAWFEVTGDEQLARSLLPEHGQKLIAIGEEVDRARGSVRESFNRIQRLLKELGERKSPRKSRPKRKR